MQSAPRSAGSTACTERSPSASTRTSSPGATSRSKTSPDLSRAHVSEATTHSPSSRPRTSGRKPNGSRNATSVPSERATIEYAPSSLRIAPATVASSDPGSLATSAAISSLSDVEESLMPSSATCARNAEAFVRFPLWPRATVRAAPWRSEEHTSELQSREKLVCRLLLEKKKQKNKTNTSTKNKKHKQGKHK